MEKICQVYGLEQLISKSPQYSKQFMVQCNPNETKKNILLTSRGKMDLTTYMESQETLNSKTFLKSKNKAGRTTMPDFKIYSKGNYQNSLELAQEYTCASMEQIREARNSTTLLQSTNL